MNQSESQTAPNRREQWLDFSKPDLWDSEIQDVADGFRNRLQDYNLNYCLHCSRLQNFDPRYIKEGECKHCKEKHRQSEVSHFGMDNGMDPGKVLETHSLRLQDMLMYRFLLNYVI